MKTLRWLCLFGLVMMGMAATGQATTEGGGRAPGGMPPFRFTYSSEIFKDEAEASRYQNLYEKYQTHEKVEAYFKTVKRPLGPPPGENAGQAPANFRAQFELKRMSEVKAIIDEILATIDVDCANCDPKEVAAKELLPKETGKTIAQTTVVAARILSQKEIETIKSELKQELRREFALERKRETEAKEPKEKAEKKSPQKWTNNGPSTKREMGQSQQLSGRSAIDSANYAQMIRTLQGLMNTQTNSSASGLRYSNQTGFQQGQAFMMPMSPMMNGQFQMSTMPTANYYQSMPGFTGTNYYGGNQMGLQSSYNQMGNFGFYSSPSFGNYSGRQDISSFIK